MIDKVVTDPQASHARFSGSAHESMSELACLLGRYTARKWISQAQTERAPTAESTADLAASASLASSARGAPYATE
jgi:hypothetical protein